MQTNHTNDDDIDQWLLEAERLLGHENRDQHHQYAYQHNGLSIHHPVIGSAETTAMFRPPAGHSTSLGSSTPTFTPATATRLPTSAVDRSQVAPQFAPNTLQAPSTGQADVCTQFPDLIRSHVDEIIRSSTFPMEEKEAYMEAVTRDEALIPTESDPIQYVRFCNYDLWAGARRLCVYWTERLKLFGPQRAFLPLTITGTGALDPSDVLAFHIGFASVLPCTKCGKLVIWFDRRKLIPTVSVENRLRCLFYLNHILTENDRNHLDGGAMAISVFVTPRLHAMDLIWRKRAGHLLRAVFPLKLEVHLLNVPHKKKPHLVTEMVNAFLDFMRRYLSGGTTSLHVHTQHESGQMLQILLSLGLTKKGIPLFFNGEWKYEHFTTWCERRKEMEQRTHFLRLMVEPLQDEGGGAIEQDQRAATSSSCYTDLWDAATNKKRKHGTDTETKYVAFSSFSSTSFFVAISTHTDSDDDNAASDGQQVSTMADGNSKKTGRKPTKRRIADILHSRRKREQKREETLALKEEHKRLVEENQRLKEEQERLNELVLKANTAVTQTIVKSTMRLFDE